MWYLLQTHRGQVPSRTALTRVRSRKTAARRRVDRPPRARSLGNRSGRGGRAERGQEPTRAQRVQETPGGTRRDPDGRSMQVLHSDPNAERGGIPSLLSVFPEKRRPGVLPLRRKKGCRRSLRAGLGRWLLKEQRSSRVSGLSNAGSQLWGGDTGGTPATRFLWAQLEGLGRRGGGSRGRHTAGFKVQAGRQGSRNKKEGGSSRK